MNKFAVDYSQLETTLDQPKTYKLADVQDKLVKVAFDIVRFFDSSDIDGLWQIQKDNDGEYIIALYEETPLTKEASNKSWDVKIGSSDVHLFYRGVPIRRFAAIELGVPTEELHLVKEYLPMKLANNSGLVREVLNSLPETVKTEILQQFPELK